MIDISEPEGVQVEVVEGQAGKVLWVNVDGVCRLRICRIEPGSIEIKTPNGDLIS